MDQSSNDNSSSASAPISVMEQFLNTRQDLIRQEKESSSDAVLRKQLSPIGRQACAIVDRIRAYEQSTIWTLLPDKSGNKSDTSFSNLQQKHDLRERGKNEDKGRGQLHNVREPIYPGMAFIPAKQRIETTKLWQIVRRMPKGCLLHAHLGAMVSFDFLIQEVMNTPGMHMSSDRCLDSHDAKMNAALEFRFRGHDSNESCDSSRSSNRSIWSAEKYEPGTFLKLLDMADQYPDGSREGFVRWLKSRCTLATPHDIDCQPEQQDRHHHHHYHHHGIDAIWGQLVNCFRATGSIICYEPIFRAFLRHMMKQLQADGVNWAELRLTLGLDFYREHAEEPETNYTFPFQIIDEELSRFKASPEGHTFWGLTTIWSSMRQLPSESLQEDMRHCIATKKKFPHLIAGYDVVGQEDLGRSLLELLPDLLWFRDECASQGVIIPFFFHAGESLGVGSSVDRNLFDAILLNTRRLGHGYSLYKHPLLIDMVKKQQILIESCPISNEVLRLCGSILQHPLPMLLARGVPCCISNDDPAFFGQDTTGLSHDFWQVLQGWDALGLAGLGSLAENSVRWAAFEGQTQGQWEKSVRDGDHGGDIKAERMRQWADEWERFCSWVVMEFSNEFGAEDVA